MNPTVPPSNPHIAGHNALSALVEFYTDVIRTYEAKLAQLSAANQRLAAEVRSLKQEKEPPF